MVESCRAFDAGFAVLPYAVGDANGLKRVLNCAGKAYCLFTGAGSRIQLLCHAAVSLLGFDKFRYVR